MKSSIQDKLDKLDEIGILNSFKALGIIIGGIFSIYLIACLFGAEGLLMQIVSISIIVGILIVIFICDFNNFKNNLKEANVAKNNFENSIKRYLDYKLINIIYFDDEFVIMNMANEIYAISYYNVNSTNFISGIYIAKELIPNLIYGKINQTYFANEEFLKKYMFIIEERLYNKLSKIKKENDINGPSKFIDLNLEKRLVRQNGKYWIYLLKRIQKRARRNWSIIEIILVIVGNIIALYVVNCFFKG